MLSDVLWLAPDFERHLYLAPILWDQCECCPSCRPREPAVPHGRSHFSCSRRSSEGYCVRSAARASGRGRTSTNSNFLSCSCHDSFYPFLRCLSACVFFSVAVCAKRQESSGLTRDFHVLPLFRLNPLWYFPSSILSPPLLHPHPDS